MSSIHRKSLHGLFRVFREIERDFELFWGEIYFRLIWFRVVTLDVSVPGARGRAGQGGVGRRSLRVKEFLTPTQRLFWVPRGMGKLGEF